MTTDEIERELRAMRPEPDPDFARRLDEWAAADFPPGAGLGSQTGRARERARGSLRRVWERIRSVPPRRVLMPVGAAATVAVVAAVAISQSGGGSSDDSSSLSSSASSSEQPAANAFENRAPSESSGTGAEAAAPPVADSATVAPDASGAAGGVARGTDQRLVDATARLSLGTEASKVQDVANQVVDVTDSHNGIVLNSRVTNDQGGARAAFSLEIPYKQLDSALSDLSGLANVISRTEGGQDITAKAVRSQRELAGTLERIRKARIALIQADTQQERLVLKSQIDSLNASANAYRTELKGVERQARFATVDVEVSSQHSGDGGAGGGWSIDDAFHDAGRVLEVIAGIGLVTLAVMLPVSIVLLLGWFVGSRTVRRRREAVLGS